MQLLLPVPPQLPQPSKSYHSRLVRLPVSAVYLDFVGCIVETITEHEKYIIEHYVVGLLFLSKRLLVVNIQLTPFPMFHNNSPIVTSRPRRLTMP